MDTLSNVKLPKGGAWVNLYAAADIGVGSALSVQCLNANGARINISPTQPDSGSGFELLDKGERKKIEPGSSVVWASSKSGSALQVQELIEESTIPLSAFGEVSVAENTPRVQMAANYGIIDKAFILKTGTATVFAEDSLFKATVNAAGETAAALSKHQITYRPGQGATNPFTALFAEGAVGSEQVAGFISSTDGFGFGYDGDSFGILHSHNGRNEIQELTVTVAAAGVENATVTINDIPYTVPLTAGTVNHNAIEITASLNTQVPGYDFTSNGAQVVAASVFSAPQASFAFSSSTAVAAWEQVVAGVSVTNDWTPLANWNKYVPADINPQKGNVYKIQFQFLGFGGIEFYVENPKTAQFDLVHRIEYPNKNITPSVTNPTFRLGWAVTNTSNATPLQIAGASTAGFIEGKIVLTEDPITVDTEIATLSQTKTAMVTIRNRTVLNKQRNRAELFQIKVSASVDSSKGALLEVLKFDDLPNPDIEFEYFHKDASISEVSYNNYTVTGGRVVDAVTVSINGNEIDLSAQESHLLPGEYLVVAMRQYGTPLEPARAILVQREDL
jgi:hypothetical protein